MQTYTPQKPKAGMGTCVPEGEYKLRVLEAKEDTSTAGNDMVKLKLRVVMPDGTDGPALFDHLVFTESALWKLDQFLASAGKHPGEGVPVTLGVNEMIGWECVALLEVEAYKGTKNNKVKSYLFEEF